MNVIDIKICSGVADILIDGRHFLDMVTDFERQFAEPGLAGAYSYLDASDVLMPSTRLLENDGDFDKVVAILECECGCEGCWPLEARIVGNASTVTWSDFKQPHRGPDHPDGEWIYSGFGPFIFGRSQYEKALDQRRRQP